MAVKRFKPVTPGTRFRVDTSTSDITTNVPEKSLVVASNKRSGGRNNSGKMTMRYMLRREGGTLDICYGCVTWGRGELKMVENCVT